MTKPTMKTAAVIAMVKGTRELDTACFAAMRGAIAMRDAASALPEGSEERSKVEALATILERVHGVLDGKLSPEGNAHPLACEIRSPDFVNVETVEGKVRRSFKVPGASGFGFCWKDELI
jgi:hypothetical protein